MGKHEKPPQQVQSPEEKREHLHAMMKALPNVMLGTYENVGVRPLLRSRPMHVSQIDDDTSIWVVTALDGDAAKQVDACDVAVVCAQSGMRYVSINGRAAVVSDRVKLAALWTPMHQVWFPNGPQDPNAVLIHFVPTEAELWDVSGASVFRYLFDAAKALISKTTPPQHEGTHATVTLQGADRGLT